MQGGAARGRKREGKHYRYLRNGHWHGQYPVTGRPWAIGVRYNVTDNCHGSDPVSCIAFDPKDNDVLVSGSWDKTLKKWRLSSGDCLATYTGHR